MVSTFTPNVGFELPARGDYVGTWDTPVNANETLADLIVGGMTTISGAAGSAVLAAAQFQCKTITFNSTLLASITITFPTSFKKSYEIQHACTGSSVFTITLQTTAAGGQVICAAPGEIIDVVNDGTNLKYKNLGRIGEYWDYAGTGAPNWVTGCTVPPYVNCDGGAIPAVYTLLPTILGSSLLPDLRGRMRLALDQGIGRVSSGGSGIAGNTLFGAGGSQFLQTHSHNITVTDPGHTHDWVPSATKREFGGGGTGGALLTIQLNNGNDGLIVNGSATTGITATSSNTGTGGNQNMPPVLVSGVMLIRAA